MTSAYLATAVRFGAFAALHVLVFAHLGEATTWGPYVQVVLYPIVILLLPVGMPSALVIVLGFLLGSVIDFSLGTYGLHAAALVLTAFLRRLVLGILEPREGYSVEVSPTRARFGTAWFARYAALLLAIHLVTFFAIEAFTFVYLGEVLLRAAGSFCVSMLLLLLYVLVVDPKR